MRATSSRRCLEAELPGLREIKLSLSELSRVCRLGTVGMPRWPAYANLKMIRLVKGAASPPGCSSRYIYSNLCSVYYRLCRRKFRTTYERIACFVTVVHFENLQPVLCGYGSG